MWICFAGCGQGSLEYFLQKFLQKSRPEIESLLIDYTTDYSLSFLDEYADEIEEPEMEEITLDYNRGRVPAWIFNRGFTPEILIDWECGSDIYGNLIIPVYDNKSRLVGSISRRLNMTPKYLYSKGLRKSRVLFGAHKMVTSDFICVTEGSLDTIWLNQNGFPAISILGATISKAQEDLLLQLPTNEIVLCLDNDEAGKIGMQKALTTLMMRCKVSRIDLLGGYKDVQDVRDVEMLKEVINSRTYW